MNALSLIVTADQYRVHGNTHDAAGIFHCAGQQCRFMCKAEAKLGQAQATPTISGEFAGHDVTVMLTNDAYQGGDDRNLYLLGVMLDDVFIAAPPAPGNAMTRPADVVVVRLPK